MRNALGKEAKPPPRHPVRARPLKSTAQVLLGALIGATLAACSPGYFLRAAYEQGKILWRREPIAELIERPDVAGEKQEKLRLVLEVREYARDALKFNVGGSYASHSFVDRPDLTYLVVAAPKTELKPYTWWFLIIGHVPYKGFFFEGRSPKRDEAVAVARLRYRPPNRGGLQYSGLVR